MIYQGIADTIGLPDYYVDEYNSTPMLNFWCVIGRLAEIFRPTAVCEIGSERGLTSHRLAEALPEAKVYVVDPAVSESVKAKPNVTAYEETSAVFLAKGIAVPFYLVDGDHNYETVSMEISRAVANRPIGEPFCMVFHDVGWPFARRDGYYNPSAVIQPLSYRHDGCLKLEADGLSDEPGGFENGRSFGLAVQSGGARNGVRTAIDDFMDENGGQDWTYCSIPLFYGTGILVDMTTLDACQESQFRGLVDAIALLSPMLACAEANRLRLLQGLSEHRHIVDDFNKGPFRKALVETAKKIRLACKRS